jgi:hypothetical protein
VVDGLICLNMHRARGSKLEGISSWFIAYGS